MIDFNTLTAGQIWVFALVLCYLGGLGFMFFLTIYFWYENQKLNNPKTSFFKSIGRL